MLTDKRLDLLGDAQRYGALTVSVLADAEGRSYKSVYIEVAAQKEAGLLVRDERSVAAPRYALRAPKLFKNRGSTR